MSNKISTLVLIALLPLFLSSCASLSKEECLNAQWYDIGYSDGTSGAQLSRLSEHREACSEYHITPNNSEYKKGREQGLLLYCQAENGLDVGLSGATYYRVCPKETDYLFYKNYKQGREIYNLEQEVLTMRERSNVLKKKLDDNDKKHKLDADDREDYEHELIELQVRIEEKEKQASYLRGQAGLSMY